MGGKWSSGSSGGEIKGMAEGNRGRERETGGSEREGTQGVEGGGKERVGEGEHRVEDVNRRSRGVQR